MSKRELGKTKEKLSVIGFGGILLNDNSQDFANAIVSKAIEMGVNYFDVAPKYGNAQDRLGPALKPYRKNCFLACKTRQRDAAGALDDLHTSLGKMQTDYFDLYQFHEFESIEEVEQAFGKNGAIETFVKAKKDGKIRHIGFSAHSVDAALLAMSKFDFDSILFPINFVNWYSGNFGPQVYKEAKKKGMGILALKSMAFTKLRSHEKLVFKNCWYRPINDDELMKLALKFTLSKNVTAAIPPGDYSLFLKALELLEDFKSISENELELLMELAKDTQPIFQHHT
jgi:predicted aldo/keto reductase-like oxidoreductase